MLIEHSSYSGPPWWQINGHLQTIFPGALRKVKPIRYRRQRLNTPDDDFLDVDWYTPLEKSDRLVILTHGLEGNSQRPYIIGMGQYLVQAGWNVLAWNCRSCSGEMNRTQRLYHHGEIGDLGFLVDHVLTHSRFREIALVGFSMGGNIILNYLGRKGWEVPEALVGAVVFSAPCRLEDAADRVDLPGNWLYRRRFMNSLKPKIWAKARQFPYLIDLSKWDDMRSWRDFDAWYSVPINGFEDLATFYHVASPENWVQHINRPTLLINADNDPFLTPACSPVELARNHPYFHLEIVKNGGHVGFAARATKKAVWSEYRTAEFLEQCIQAKSQHPNSMESVSEVLTKKMIV